MKTDRHLIMDDEVYNIGFYTKISARCNTYIQHTNNNNNLSRYCNR